MSNQRVLYSGVLTLVLPATLGLSCLKRDWSVCSPKDECQKGYTCTADWRCVRDVDGGADGLVAVDSQGTADGAVGVDAPVSTDAAVGPAIGRDGGEPDAPVFAAPDAPVSTGPALDGSEPDRIPVVAPPDAPAATVPDGSPDAPAPDLALIGPTVDAAVGCVKRSDCPGVCQTCTNFVCTAAKSQDDTLCAGTCDSTGACKSKQGQTCQTVAAGCAAGTFCSPEGYCCDKACTGSCEACDVTPGTCTTLASGTPHKNHTACTTSSTTVCDGKCTGASNACWYPTGTTVCGSESCSTAGYQGTGTCGGGSCTMPGVVTCPNACVVGTGCTGSCKPGQTQCKTTGISQKCNANGTWDDTTCASGNTCSNSTCACSSPNTQCPSGCINILGNDANNCGSCSHVCGNGATCSSGLCQPVVILSTGAPNFPAILGVDGNWVYYEAYDANQAYTYNAFRVSKSAVGGTATTLALGPSRDEFFQVISSGLYNVLFFGGQGTYNDCSFSSDGGPTCTNTTQSLPWPVIPSKSTTQPHPVLCAQSTSGGDAIDWYSMSGGLLNRVSFDPASTNGCDPSISTAYGDAVYWIRTVNGSSVLLSVPFSGGYTTMTAGFTGAYTVLDANSRSVLLAGPSGLYRVALPGNSSAQPPSLIGTGSTVNAAIEDANGVYWIQSDGNLNSCTLSTCASGNPKNLANNLGLVWDLFQDDSFLYWTSNTVGQGLIMRLAK